MQFHYWGLNAVVYDNHLNFVMEQNGYRCLYDDALYNCDSDYLIDSLYLDVPFSGMRNIFHFDEVTAFRLQLA